MKETDTSRHERRKNRENKLGLELHAHQSEDTDEITACGGEGSVSDCGVVQGGSDMVNNMVNQSSRDTQTDISGADMDGMQTEINRLLEENRNLKEKLADKGMHASAFEGNKEKVKYYTGLASFITLTVLLNYLLPYLPRGNRRVLSPFQMLIVCFMRLRLNLPVQHIAYLFQLHRTTIANIFVETVSVMYTRLSPLVYWPDRESLRTSMPHQFLEAFGTNVAVIIDCFEVFIERPSNLKARSQTFSHYKHAHTIKYLIGITPQGVIHLFRRVGEGALVINTLLKIVGF